MPKLFQSEKFIFLLLVSKVPEFKNSYILTKVLSRKFGIINFVELSDRLIEEKLINEEIINRNIFLNITQAGVIYLKENWNIAKPILASEFPEEIEFIRSIFEK